MLTVIRRVGIAIGSLVIAYLAVSLVAGLLLGQWAQTNSTFVAVVSVVLGGFVYVDIMRRERRGSSADKAPLA
jgi:general stress protein CsbA